MHKFLVVAAVAAAACSGKGDECQRFVDKSKPVLGEMMKTAGKGADLGKFVDECRKNDKMKKDPVFKCVLDAKDEAAVKECYGKAFGDYMTKGKKSEADLQLNKLGKNAKVAFITNAEFPKGTVGPTPATPCCKGDKGKCPVSTEWTSSPVWTALDFQIDEPTFFQYSYESDGKTATATAVGDLDCDGTTITYRLELTAEGGEPTMKLTPPEPNTD